MEIAPTTCDPESPTLCIGKDGGIGSRGPKVTELQQDLTRLGYGNLLGTPAIGPNTENAVKKFKQDNHLIVDGICNFQVIITGALFYLFSKKKWVKIRGNKVMPNQKPNG